MNYTRTKLKELFPRSCDNIYCGASWPETWNEPVIKALGRLENETSVVVAQIKAKFGGLRIYFDAKEWGTLDTKLADEIVSEAESACWKIERTAWEAANPGGCWWCRAAAGQPHSPHCKNPNK